MDFDISQREHFTIVTALRFFVMHKQTDPRYQIEQIQARIAIMGLELLDSDGVDALCVKLTGLN